MGANNSKPSPTKEHVFSADTPVRFSPDLIQSLEDSPESDSTRHLDHELLIQKRVNAELSRLESSTSQQLREIQERLSADPPAVSPAEPTVEGGEGADALAQTAARQQKEDSLSRESVQKEIENLKRKLGERRLREEKLKEKGDGDGGGEIGLKGVEGAKKELVNCLRVNDRRPLDCWKEVEEFKREVGRLEGQFLRGVGE